MKKQLRDILLGAIALVIFAGCIGHQMWFYKDWHQGSGKYIQTLDIPSEDAIKILSFGYDVTYADVMTLKAVQNFGAGWDTENYTVDPMYNYFNVLTELDPHFIEVYEFSNLVMSDQYQNKNDEEEEKGDRLSIQLLRKGIANNPTEHRLPYLAMYTALWNMQDNDLAKSFLPMLKRIPTTPPHVLRMEEYIERQSGRFQIAFDVNLGHLLLYMDKGMEVETDVSIRKFQTILDGWNKLEMSRAAEAYFEATGEHPETIEQLILDGYLTEFEGATFESVSNAVDAASEKYSSLEPHKDEIRAASIVNVKGLPKDPFGYWYFIEPSSREMMTRFIQDDKELWETLPIVDRYSYITSTGDYIERINARSISAQSFIQNYRADTDVSPTYDEMINFLSDDFIGGHFVYFPAVEGEDGRVLPRFFSTTTMRILENREPRMGLSGPIENFPTYPVGSYYPTDQKMSTTPSIWDYEEDFLWALCRGLVPGVPIQEQAPEVISNMRTPDVYIHCDDHILPPD